MTPEWRIDKNGRPIEPGDLLRSYHFQGGPRNRKYYLYHVATIINGDLTAVPYSWLHKKPDENGQVNFRIHKGHSAIMEIIAGGDHKCLWDERKKVKE